MTIISDIAGYITNDLASEHRPRRGTAAAAPPQLNPPELLDRTESPAAIRTFSRTKRLGNSKGLNI